MANEPCKPCDGHGWVQATRLPCMACKGKGERAVATVTLTLTEREAWAAWQGFEASFADPDSMNEHERSVQRKLISAHRRARRKESNDGTR